MRNRYIHIKKNEILAHTYTHDVRVINVVQDLLRQIVYNQSEHFERKKSFY
jgi:hypothetical protein